MHRGIAGGIAARAFLAFLAVAAFAPAWAAKGKGGKLILLEGRKFGEDDKGAWSGPQQQALARWKAEGDNTISSKVNFPTRGVWYVWLKVKCPGPWPAILTWDLDGVQPLLSSRREILVQPGDEAVWTAWTRFPGFRIEINVDEPGEHTLRLLRKSGNAEVHSIILTLFFSAKLSGDTLDMTGDPGGGRIEFPRGDLSVDGFRKDFRAPELKVAGVSYFIDAEKGDDGAAGTSPGKAWKSAERANAAPLKPGDAILLKRGTRLDGGLAPKGRGTEEAWITLGAYGEGDRPVVRGIARPGLALTDQSFWAVRDIAFCSDPEYGQSAVAITASDKAPRPRGIRLTNCLAYDSGKHGIEVGGQPGVDGVVVENCLAFYNPGDGICIWGSTARGSSRNAVVRNCTTYTNAGMAGIWMSGTENGLIEGCVAYNNACVNIWAWNAVNITMRRCEVFRGRPQRDAAGFDIDWGSQACTLEYCYSHHNEGDEYLLMGSGDLAYLDHTMQSNYNIMRWCVADGHSPIDMGETFNHCLVYNNLAIARGKDAKSFRVFGWPNDSSGGNGGWPKDTRVLNNVFLALDGASALYVDDHGTDQGNSWDYNLYFMDGKPRPLARWGGRANGPGFWDGDSKTGSFPAKEYADLESFRKATGQEANGMQADPGLSGLADAEYGRLPLKECRPGKGFPGRGKGKPGVLAPEWLAERRKHLTETGAEKYGIPMDPAPDTKDYWGEELGGAFPIGPGK